ncbi:hypothetical protein D9611_007372 [Ephemerocybe angulata]|uniref:Protein kinase domain-containing protein n=2 Tax=Ephemerocybe angulata TaxID=980116 RepID=A0A8H5FL22_9AGAR|nr:hypothetical protein D9611_007372 [Tulosesus angulatus]
MCSAYLSIPDTDNPVKKVKAIVKFTEHYSEDMHNILAAEGYAPKLYYCERVIGGVYMIVMEYVEGESIWAVILSPPPTWTPCGLLRVH